MSKPLGQSFDPLATVNHLPDGQGRSLIVWKDKPFHARLSFQDNGRTLKVFLVEQLEEDTSNE